VKSLPKPRYGHTWAFPRARYNLRMTITFAAIFFATAVGGLLLLAAVLHSLSRLGSFGRMWAKRACEAPLLDAIVFLFTGLPPIAGLVVGLTCGFSVLQVVALIALGILAQYVALLIWIAAHELAHRGEAKGVRIVSTMNRIVGPVRNTLAVWWTSLAVPLFLLVRLAEILIYPPLIWLVNFPRYRHREWVNVTRHKFDGLVGYDRIWCLYCDWMTGVWSLGGEMLRNVESFWCPIRFNSPEKCANCRVDFPDIDGGWVPADGKMKDVVELLDQKYPGPGVNTWYGHPARLTVEGKDVNIQKAQI
jgi:hypothetical protein